jgi:hypothetical protein
VVSWSTSDDYERRMFIDKTSSFELFKPSMLRKFEWNSKVIATCFVHLIQKVLLVICKAHVRALGAMRAPSKRRL